MSKKFTFEYVKNYFEERGCELLEKEYKNNGMKMRYKCNCGNISKIRFSDFKKGKRCRKCGSKKGSNKNRYSLKYVKQYFLDNNCELLEKEYKNNAIKIKYKCCCGNISKIRFADFKKGQKCMKCSGMEKYTFRYIYNYFKKNNCELLEKEYKNNDTKIKYKCKCGNISKIRFADFKRGRRCKKCGIEKVANQKRHTFKYIYNYFKENDCKLLEKEYKNSKKLMKYECNCGNISKISFTRFQRGQRCKKCGIKKNSGKNHFNYNLNLTDQERKDNESRTSNPHYKRWRKKVFIRDLYICQRCNVKGKYLNSHHIKNYSSNPELRLDVSNGITLCKECHIEFHLIYGIKHNTKQQLDEFFKSFNCRKKAVC